MTLDQIASTIRNHVVDALGGASETTFSIEQLKDEIMTAASGAVARLAAQGVIQITELAQRLDGIAVATRDLSLECPVGSELCAPHFEIPNLNRAIDSPIIFLGSLDSKLSFKVYYNRDYRYHRYRLATSRKPFAWVSSSKNVKGLYDVFLFNMGKYNTIKFLSMDVLLDNPYDLLATPYYNQFAEAEFYAPLLVQEEIIDKLTQKYVNYYRQLHMQIKPNVQQG